MNLSNVRIVGQAMFSNSPPIPTRASTAAPIFDGLITRNTRLAIRLLMSTTGRAVTDVGSDWNWGNCAVMCTTGACVPVVGKGFKTKKTLDDDRA